MSVVKSKRKLSTMEFFHNALLLRKSVTELLMRDFGVKGFKRNIKFVGSVEHFEPEDKRLMEEVFDKYNMGRCFEDEYPNWLIEKERIYFLDILRSLIKNIVKANTIYPVNMNEYKERRSYQNNAISDCEDLLQEMQYMISIVPVDAEKYMQYVEIIEKEIALLKGWRKGDNKIASRLEKKQEESKD